MQTDALVSETGKLDELLFTVAGQIFLVLYNRFEGLRFESVWRFDETVIKWTKHADLKVRILLIAFILFYCLL